MKINLLVKFYRIQYLLQLEEYLSALVNLSTKLNWLSKIIFYSICKKLNDSEVQSYYFNENISYLAKTKDLVELFKLSNELNIFIKELAGGINLNNKIQIKALLSSC